MKHLFLDTNIYNHVSETDIDHLKRCVAENQLEILTTPQILAELAATFEKNKERGSKVCTIYADLISENVLQPPPVLIKTEIGSLLDGRPRLLYLEGENRAEFFTYLEKLKNGDLDLYTSQFIDRITNLKKEQFKFSKLGYSKVEPHVVKDPLKKYPTFDQFLKEGIKRKERLKELERYVVKDLGDDAHRAARFIERRLHKTPHLAIALRIVPAVTYYYHAQKNRPKHGDIFDCGYFVCLATADGFVSDDERARDLFRLVCPSKASLSLNEFLNTMSPA